VSQTIAQESIFVLISFFGIFHGEHESDTYGVGFQRYDDRNKSCSKLAKVFLQLFRGHAAFCGDGGGGVEAQSDLFIG
jgi:hypothetical protein